MCGILFCTNSEPVDEIFNDIKYRGPDNTTVVRNDHWFCHHRLRIIQFSEDLEIGNQPTEYKGVMLICNGEIYNYKNIAEELKITDLTVDCDIITRIYLMLGTSGLSKLDGDFAFVLYDTHKKIIITGRDPVGLKPLFLGYDNNNMLVGACSALKVLEKIKNIVSIIQHPIGEVLIIENLKMTGRKYLMNYDRINNEIIDSTVEIAIKKIRNYLIKAVEKRVKHNNVPYAFLCSGGVDSSIILAICSRILRIKDIYVFTLKYADGNSFDSVFANMLTESLGIKNHTTVTFTKDEGLGAIKEVIEKLETYDPNTIRASIPMYLLAKYIKKNTKFKVILSGEGADELFMGYNYFGIMNPTSDQAKVESARLVKNLHSFDVLRAERCFSSHGLELRVPFLDKDLINYVLRLPGNLRLPRYNIEKWILREAFKDILPERLLNREKERMSDGIGYSWVPSLINHASETGHEISKQTDTKAMLEKGYYKNVYNSMFKTDCIIDRDMPTWCKKIENNMLSS